MTPPITSNLIGQLLMEQYLVLEPLETGGFSQTYLALDTEKPAARCCVLKLMDTQLNPGLDFCSLHHFFEAEAHALGRLGALSQLGSSAAITRPHRSVPKLIAYCRDRTQVYLVQEFIEGERLDRWMDQVQPPTLKQVIQILSEILLILYQIHGQGIIHCDIKPSNLIRRKRDGKLMLIDFGACFISDRANYDICQMSPRFNQAQFNQAQFNQDCSQNFALGTLGYMPEEQTQGKPQFSSDLYALGMMIIQILTGVAPQQLERYPITQEWDWHQHIRKSLLSLQLIPILDRMVRINPRDRYKNAAEAIAAVQEMIPQSVMGMPPTVRVPIPRPELRLDQPAPTIPKTNRQRPIAASAIEPDSIELIPFDLDAIDLQSIERNAVDAPVPIHSFQDQHQFI
jgi:serine/threonine protein kinase